jgi:apolipoprotein N-acyltransferase
MVIPVYDLPAHATAARYRAWWSWAWLAVGAALLPFSLFQTVLPLAAWLAPVFLLRFARTQRAIVALPLIGLVSYLATLIATRGFFSAPQSYLFALAGLFSAIAYGLDRLLVPRLRGVLRTLVFPLADTTLNLLFSSSDFGIWGLAAYTQAANLPLLQIVSLTGRPFQIGGYGFSLGTVVTSSLDQVINKMRISVASW